jgi:hypothetical protein
LDVTRESAVVAPALSQATYVPGSPPALARALHVASAPANPPRFPVEVVLVTKMHLFPTPHDDGQAVGHAASAQFVPAASTAT